jgi:hypothetical protein
VCGDLFLLKVEVRHVICGTGGFAPLREGRYHVVGPHRVIKPHRATKNKDKKAVEKKLRDPLEITEGLTIYEGKEMRPHYSEV